MSRKRAFLSTFTLMILIASSVSALRAASPAAAADPVVTGAYGDVRDARHKTISTVVPNDLPPVAGATVSISLLGVTTVTDARGQFFIPAISIPSNLIVSGTYARVEVLVTAPGFGTWDVSNLPLYVTGGGSRFYVELGTQPVQRVFQIAEERQLPLRSAVNPSRETPKGPGLASPLAAGCSGYSSQLMPPGQIVLYRHNLGYIETVNFNFYIRGVLPREWHPTDPLEALKAGALAIREYSWYTTNNWRGDSFNGTCYDLSDDPLHYQDYDPTVANANTDNAVSAVWDWKMFAGGALFDAQYAAGTPGEACGAGATGVQMSQNGTVTCANQGMAWWQIVNTYYYPISQIEIGTGPAATATRDSTNNYLDVFVRADNGSVYQTYRRNGTWFPWTSLGAPPPGAVGDPGAAWGNNGNQLELSIRGNDGHLWNRHWDSTFGWAGWADLGVIAQQGPGSAGSRTGYPATHFYLNSSLQEQSVQWNGSSWAGQPSMGAPGGLHNATLPWRPTGTYWVPSASQLDTYVVSNDADNGLYRNYSTDGGASWVGWVPISGGKISSAPSATAYTSGNQLDVLVRGLDSAIYRIYTNAGGWQAWTTLAAPPAGTGSGPGATWANVDSELDVFVRDGNSHLYWRQLIGGSWTGWSDLGAYP
jgi:hypothetical protein